MAYDQDGNWTALVPKDDDGFVNEVTSPPAPNDGLGTMTVLKALPLIQKLVG